MNPTTTNALIGLGVTLTGVVVSTVAQKKVREKKPEWVDFTTFTGGLLVGVGLTIASKNYLTTKSEAGAILAAG